MTDPLDPRTLPKRTATNSVSDLLLYVCIIISQMRLVAPITLVGRTALSVEIITKRFTLYLSASFARLSVPRQLFFIASFGDVSISGGLNTRKDVEADSFHMSGAGEIHGLLNAEEIDITVSGIPRTIKIGQIGGSEICIRPSTSVSLLGRLFGNKTTGVAQVGEIEGDEIDLASTTADVVRGTNVTLREGCHIRRVEYTGDLVLEGDAQVDEKVQV